MWVKRRHVKEDGKVGTVLKLNSCRAGRLLAALAATLVFGLVGTGAALADDPASLPAYGGPGGTEQGTVDQGTPPGQVVLGEREAGTNPTQPTTGGNEVLPSRTGGNSSPTPATADAPSATTPPAANTTHRLVGNLPFTGLDLVMVALVGIVLLALGFALRRLTSTPQVG